jgi:hypothetical protein
VGGVGGLDSGLCDSVRRRFWAALLKLLRGRGEGSAPVEARLYDSGEDGLGLELDSGRFS